MAPIKPATRSRRQNGNAASLEEAEVEEEEVAQPASSDISSYEQARLENIRRNEQLLTELGIAAVRSSMPAPSKAARKTPKAPPRPKPAALPTRRSSRVTADKLIADIRRLQDEGNAVEAAEKQSELDELLARQQQGAYVVEPAASSVGGGIGIGIGGGGGYDRISPEPLPLANLLNAESDPEAQVAALKAALSSAAITSSSSSSAADADADMSRLRLAEDGVVKLTASRVTSVALHPSCERILGAAGDKLGGLGLWDVSSGAVYRYQPHSSSIMRLCFSQSSPVLQSLSYDGSLRALDLQAERWLRAFQSPDADDAYLTDACWMKDSSHCVLVSRSDGAVGLVDSRASSEVFQWCAAAQDSRLTSVQQHPTELNVVVTASSKTGIALHDMRCWAALSTLTDIHSKSINAAYVSPDGRQLISVSQDDTVKATSLFMGSAPRTAVLRHNNFTGRWLSTFRPAFDERRPATFLLGSMLQPRRIEVISVVSGRGGGGDRLEVEQNLQDELLGSVCSRNAFHPHLNMVIGANSSGRVHLFR